MVIYLSHLLVTPSTDIDHIHDAQFHDEDFEDFQDFEEGFGMRKGQEKV